MSENGDCEIDFTLGIHIDKQYKAELKLINFIKKSNIYNVIKDDKKHFELKQKQVQYFAQRIYATYIFKKLLKEFDNEIKAYPYEKINIDSKEKGRDVTGGIMNESLWWIPTVQGKYKNQRFVSEGLWEDSKGEYWKDHNIELKKVEDLRMEHVIDKASSKQYIIKELAEKKLCNKGFHSDIINDLKSLLFGCIILKTEHSSLPTFGSINADLLAKKDVFRKYIKNTVSHNTAKDINDYIIKNLKGGIKVINPKKSERYVIMTKNNDEYKFIKPSKQKQPLLDFQSCGNLGTNYSIAKVIKGGRMNNLSKDKVTIVKKVNMKIPFLNEEIKIKKNWLVPVFDRELGHYLHCDSHPYNPHKDDCEKKKKHYKFIESVFALDKKIEKKSEEKIKEWLNQLPKVDGQFMTKDKIKEQNKGECDCT